MTIYLYTANQIPDFSPYRSPNDPHDGLICLTETIEPQHLLAAYPHGAFPWYEDDENRVYWFTQNPRAVLLPEKLHIRQSLQKTLRRQAHKITVNHCFDDVIEQCATIKRAGQGGSWISARFQAAYRALHRMGHAHSFECWLPENGDWALAGGLYGVQIGSVFYGESMFSRQANASQMAFAHAVPFLRECGIRLIDCQQDTDHLRQFGSQLMNLRDFKDHLRQYNAQPLTRPIVREMLFQAA
ncbi:leucyl/phenylalanyl-tRNA--protein transferase [Alysiella filiformis]|uniref:Leucyl/phenylalanyl-tRNA--protein transferase n=1 Tax=Alysiella filiformis DSM 16848 TaxID=1120981 RepID=A0A286E777_9NEIS|nr:leucyl/phenylalanyl-tRNA--protein transferase [Alysiella filiformis]QMT31578.1 leucyl/phenylalanyl-tRNA--protein transferase [Alysiella filiformis]UBQ55409.1 leucyl/phenylalanyl-tRNA--protein transferase [Alysiella filiformis DSM 16848]SOD66743.1 leucyl/phenylalanyl-tRNA--protein transferase [Alysiella filiformis DSM 16848]